VICIQLCAQNSYHMTDRRINCCTIVLCHQWTPLQWFPTYSREQECFLQPEQFTPPPKYKHKINKSAVKLQKRLFEVCRLFSELQKICSLFQIASWSNQCGGSATEYTACTGTQLRGEHIILTYF